MRSSSPSAPAALPSASDGACLRLLSRFPLGPLALAPALDPPPPPPPPPDAAESSADPFRRTDGLRTSRLPSCSESLEWYVWREDEDAAVSVWPPEVDAGPAPADPADGDGDGERRPPSPAPAAIGWGGAAREGMPRIESPAGFLRDTLEVGMRREGRGSVVEAEWTIVAEPEAPMEEVPVVDPSGAAALIPRGRASPPPPPSAAPLSLTPPPTRPGPAASPRSTIRANTTSPSASPPVPVAPSPPASSPAPIAPGPSVRPFVLRGLPRGGRSEVGCWAGSGAGAGEAPCAEEGEVEEARAEGGGMVCRWDEVGLGGTRQ